MPTHLSVQSGMLLIALKLILLSTVSTAYGVMIWVLHRRLGATSRAFDLRVDRLNFVQNDLVGLRNRVATLELDAEQSPDPAQKLRDLAQAMLTGAAAIDGKSLERAVRPRSVV